MTRLTVFMIALAAFTDQPAFKKTWEST